MTIEIPLTNGLVALVDDEDGPWALGYKWHASENGHTWYAQRNARASEATKVPLMHVELTGFARTDHVNGNGLDNRRENLRAASPSQNRMNARKAAGQSSQYKGVTFIRRARRWQAQIGGHGAYIYLGLFGTEREAALAYDAAARIQFGTFAALNFPGPGERSALAR